MKYVEGLSSILGPIVVLGIFLHGSNAFAIDVVVHVDDAHGKPVPSFPLTLLTRPATSSATEPSLDRIVDRTRTDERGCAQVVIPSDTPLTISSRFILLAGTIENTLREIEVHPLDETDIHLVLPPCGEVVLLAPKGVDGSLALRARPMNPQRRWPFSELNEVKMGAGPVRFPWVALDLTLQYRLSTEREGRSIETFEGPTREGEVVTLTARHPNETTLQGRLMDQATTTLGNVEANFSLKPHSIFGRFDTDRHGRFRLHLSIPTSQTEGPIVLTIIAGWHDEGGVPHYGRARISMEPSQLAPGTIDLGDVVVVIPGTPSYFATMSNEELEEAYASSLETYSCSQRDLSLLEMARRASPRWLSFLESELQRVSEEFALRRIRPAQREELPRDQPTVDPLVDYLTALRRAQQRNDPVALIVEPTSVLQAVFPESPIVVLRLENRDEENANIVVQDGGDYRSGRFERCRVFATNEAGISLPHLPSPSTFGGGLSRYRSLRKGESIEFAIPLSAYVDLSTPGRYRTEVLYKNTSNISFSPEDSFVPGICYRTAPFDVEVLPRHIEISRAEAAAIESWIDALDVFEPVLVLNGPHLCAGEVNADIEDPIKGLLNSGFKGVPILLDRLEVEESRLHRAWIFGLLWNLTGLSYPDDRHGSNALGTIRYSTRYQAAQGNTHVFGHGSRTGEIHQSVQDEWADQWLRRRQSLEVVWTD